MSDEKITLSLEDARHLFDLAIDTPLLCSGSFETDDVAVLRKLATLINVDPATATPEEFVYDFPHPFKPFTTSGEHNYVYDATAPGGSRPETVAEVYARLGENPDRCNAGSYNRLCRRPASDPIHQADSDERIAVETPDVTVKVSRELLAELATWSEPVQVMVENFAGEYTMVARRHDCPTHQAAEMGA